jgi:hypothetical protein
LYHTPLQYYKFQGKILKCMLKLNAWKWLYVLSHFTLASSGTFPKYFYTKILCDFCFLCLCHIKKKTQTSVILQS